MYRIWKLLFISILCFGGLALFKSTHDINKILTSPFAIVASKYVTVQEESVGEKNFHSENHVNEKLHNIPVNSPGNKSQSGDTRVEYKQVQKLPGNAGNLKNISLKVYQTVANDVQEGKADPSIPKIKAILLLSSVGRSGSSFLGEILASQGDNIYLFEPVRAVPKNLHTKQIILETLLTNFQCKITDSFVNIGKSPYVSVRHPYVLNKNKGSISTDKIRSICLKEPLRIIKTIRTRLQWTKELLEDENLDLKVIHLVRDPRGSSTSMNELEWHVTIEDTCNHIKNDLDERTEMKQRYPDRYHFIKYEDICRDPFGKTQEIFRFLKGNNTKSIKDSKTSHSSLETKNSRQKSYTDIPLSVFDYLKSHTKINFFSSRTPWSTNRDSLSHYQKWRQKITERELSEVELHCRDVIETLGHRLFRSLGMVRNMTIPLSDSSSN